MKRIITAALEALAFCVALGADPSYHDWASVDGYANQAANWSGGSLPSASEAPRFTGSGSYVIRFPAGGYTIPGNFTTVRNLDDGSTVTFDATEGDWLQESSSYFSNWQAFMVCANKDGSWPHILNVTSATGGKPLFRLSGGKVRLTRNASAGSVLELLSGSWNFYDPTGTANTTHGLALLDATAADKGSRVVFRAGSSLRAANFSVNCGTMNSRVVFEGGEHELIGDVLVGHSSSPGTLGATYCPVLQISGGAVRQLTASNLKVGNRTGREAKLLLDGTGRLEVGKTAMLATTASATGTLAMADNACLTAAENLSLGAANGALGAATLSDSASLVISGGLIGGSSGNSFATLTMGGSSRLDQRGTGDVIKFGWADGSVASFTMENNAEATIAGRLTLGGATSSSGTMTLRDAATVTVTDTVTGLAIGRGRGSVGVFHLAGNARLLLPNVQASNQAGICLSGSNNQWGDYRAASARLLMEGGTISAPNGQFVLCGTNSFVTLAGGETSFYKWWIKGDTNTVWAADWMVPTNTVLVTGGTHAIGSKETGSDFVVGESGAHARLEVRGGSVTAYQSMSVGIGNTGLGSATFALSGTGRVDLKVKNSGSGVYVASGSAQARARVELTGGELVASCIKGGLGESEFVADGGWMTLNGTNVTAAIHSLTRASLGASGLTLDTAGYDATVAQVFADEGSVDGLFTKVGAGTLTATMASGHARTVVADGTLAMTNAFGRSFEVAAGATLDVTDATGLTAEDMTLGTAVASQSATIVGDWPSPITVTGALSIAGKTGLLLADATTPGVIELFRVSGTMYAAELANLEVVNVSSTREYAFTATDDDGTTVVSLTISAVEVTDNTWTGAEGSAWETENFTTAPTSSHRYVFPSDAATKNVTVPGEGATARGLSVAGDYSFQGGTLALMGGVTVTAGSATFGNPLDLKGDLTFDVADNTTLTLNGPLAAQAIGVTRTGNGAFVLGAANTDFFGGWSLAGGYHRFSDGAAFGTDGDAPVTFVSGTLQYTGATPGTLSRPVVVAGASDRSRVVIDAGVGLTLSNGLYSTHGGIVKTGSGTLEIVCPEGTVALGTGNANNGDGAVSSVPANGTSPSDSASNVTAGMDILDGMVRVTGSGKDKTTVNQTQKTWIGTGYSGQSAPVALEIEKVTYNQGGASRALVVGGGVASGKDNVPTLRVKDAVVSGNTLQLGNGSATSYPTVVVTNSTVEMIYEVTIGQENDNVHPVVRIGTGGIVRQNRLNGSATGIVLNRNVDVEVSDGGVLESRKGDNNSNCGVKFNAGAFGRMRFTDGGRLRTYMFTAGNTPPSSEKHMSLEFDGGVLEMTRDGNTSLGTLEHQVFTVGEDGMEVAIGSGISHGFATPFTGAGTVVKTGVGSMKLLPSAVSGRDVIETEGGLEVREGAVDLGGETIAVSGIWGGGAVTNGTLTGVILARPDADGLLTLGENLTAGSGVTVSVTADDPGGLARGQVVPVAAVDGATVNVSAWKCRVASADLRGECSLVDGVAYVTLKPRSGVTLIIR